ncbi:hypothetical protein AVEN_135354-1 [Araneus ventricosus]|uniref:Metalloendopeptidase n=1 Tax=Araneus ventricosus TaxID=182803 RepID=A0A4Y2T4N9_ARAVE|nr:hypothetical protein AVEN_135354-1 [Araneus ventricosus]
MLSGGKPERICGVEIVRDGFIRLSGRWLKRIWNGDPGAIYRTTLIQFPYLTTQIFDISRLIKMLHISQIARQIDNFNITDPIDELWWAAYDYTSIMHYGEYAFSKQPGVLKTMEAKDGKTKLLEPYDRPGLNNNDIDLVKKLYKCK